MIYSSDKRTKGGSLGLGPSAETCPRLAELLQRWGGAPLAYFALLPDKRGLFGDHGDHGDQGGRDWGIAYRAQGRHALALGDPLGDPQETEEAVGAFLTLCRKRRWSPAFYQVTPDRLDVYARAGLRAVKVGEDAQIHLTEFSLVGKRFKNLRNDLRRLEKSGLTREEHGPDAPPCASVAVEMATLNAAWRRAHRAREGSFAMGGFARHSALFRDSRYFLARDGETGRLLAFASFVPAWGPVGTTGWTLDLMRRGPDSPHGVMDFLIVSAAQQFGAEGADVLSLGLSPLAGASEASESKLVALVRRLLYTRMGRVYNFQGLHVFKSKFATHWEARYLVCRPGPALVGAAGAVLKAHLTPGDIPSQPSGPRIGRVGRTQVMAFCGLLLLLFTPYEKTLAHRAPRLSARLSGPLSAERMEASRVVQTWDRRSARAGRAVWRRAAGRVRAAGARSFPRRS